MGFGEPEAVEAAIIQAASLAAVELAKLEYLKSSNKYTPLDLYRKYLHSTMGDIVSEYNYTP